MVEYYCAITGVDAPDNAPNHFSVGYELREEVTNRVLFASTMAIVVPTEGTVDQRFQAVVNQLIRHFDDLIARTASRDEALQYLRNHLVGQRHPSA